MTASMRWDSTTERTCHRLVVTVCDATAPTAERQRAWQGLLVAIAPHVEAWARRSRLLRRTGLLGDDELRSILVDAIARLRERDFANLRGFLARQPGDPGAAPDDEQRALEALLRTTATGDDAAPPDEDLTTGTPLRGWLVGLTDFAVRDHVKRRLGYRPDAAPGQPATRRAVNTGAERLDHQPEPAARPPLTDALAMKSALAEIEAFLAGLPPPMGAAVRLWTEDVGFDHIAAELGLRDATAARNLVRAGQARLRDRFRDRWPELFGPG